MNINLLKALLDAHEFKKGIMMRYGVQINGRWKNFDTETEAIAFATRYFQRTGIILGVECRK